MKLQLTRALQELSEYIILIFPLNHIKELMQNILYEMEIASSRLGSNSKSFYSVLNWTKLNMPWNLDQYDWISLRKDVKL